MIFVLTKIYIKKILSSFLTKFIMLSYFLGFIILFLFEDFVTISSLFFVFFPYLTLFLTPEMIKDEIEKGYLENRFFLLSTKFKILNSKKIAILLIALSSFFSIFFSLFFIAIIKGENLDVSLTKLIICFLISLYYVHLGLLTGFLFKGSSNALIIIFAQIIVFFVIAKALPDLFLLLENRIPLDFSTKIKLITFLSFYPNFILDEKFNRYFYILVINTLLIACLIEYFYKKFEFKKVQE